MHKNIYQKNIKYKTNGNNKDRIDNKKYQTKKNGKSKKCQTMCVEYKKMLKKLD